MNQHLTSEQRTISAQRIRIEELEEQIRQMRENIAPVVLFPKSWELRPAQQRIPAAFARAPNGFLTTEQIFVALDSDATEADNLVKTQICGLRRRVENLGIKIVTRWSLGYEMTPDSVAFVRSTIRGRAEVA